MVALLTPAVALAGHRCTDYREAWEASQKQDKPILALFFNSANDRAATAKLMSFEELADRFIVLEADKSTPTGKEVFATFAVAADDACIVIERSRQWQYCRYDRKLSRDELQTVLSKTQSAKGKPEVDVLQSAAAQESQRSQRSYWTYCST
jgi:tellurite resistance protein